MKKLSKAQKSEIWRRIKSSGESVKRTKTELINAAREAARGPSQSLLPDGNDDAWVHRRSANLNFVQNRGGVSRDVANLALNNNTWETKELVAGWLRSELKLLRDAKAKPGAAPVRRGKTLSKILISEIAIEMLECIAGQNLICLFQELLEIDRHRKWLSQNFSVLDRAAQIDAQAQLQGIPLGVRQLAKHMFVLPSSVTRWKRVPLYAELVKSHKEIWERLLREEYFEQIKMVIPRATDAECFRRAFVMYVESIQQRRSNTFHT